jgi:hypothetical protein
MKSFHSPDYNKFKTYFEYVFENKLCIARNVSF